MHQFKVTISFLLLAIFLTSCQGMQQTSQGAFQENMRGVTPKDVQSFTQKIITGEYQFDLNRTEQGQSSLYYETEWKNLDLTPDEEELGISEARLRIKIRTQKLRRGMDEYTVHNLKFTADLQGVTPESNGDFVNITITPQREDYISDLYRDYKTEFDAGVMEY